MLEPCEGKLSCTVLRGESGSNTADLLDHRSDRVLVEMIVQLVAVAGQTAVVRFWNTCLAAGVNAVFVFLHPGADLAQDLLGSVGNVSFGVRSHVQNQVSALGYALYQLFDQHL